MISDAICFNLLIHRFNFILELIFIGSVVETIISSYLRRITVYNTVFMNNIMQ